MKNGSLVVVGSGIKSVGHLTVETKGWIQQSDVVLYCVADPTTEVWIKQNSKFSVDLYQFYGNDRRRLDTYIDMSDEMLKYVRQGKSVCGVFYGHPGVFVYPSHRAVRIARDEGHKAAILPAISALDCLYADCDVDPSSVGSQTVEATDLLLRSRQLLTDEHVVIWQIGCVGDLGFNFSGYDNRHLNILVDYLEKFYDADHEVVHYVGSQYPMCPAIVQRMPLKDLRTASVTGLSTLYIPPQDELKTDVEMARRLGLKVRKVTPEQAKKIKKTDMYRVARKGTHGAATTGTENEKAKSAQREGMGSRYFPSPDESGLADFISELCASPRLLAEFKRNPERTADLHASLTEAERSALLSQHSGRIRMAIKQAHFEDPRVVAVDETHRLHAALKSAAE
ncbi:hypothetical protein NHU_00890 [Rhodovulum sulfidophilum]|uniref:Tetrapyrrole methylase domain-containing protein n=1 Tax=Rhodovulum sulfidophilum TaxID=35806 RepID=A0A0D6AYW8_RHOSU|nr:hypothetical protein NHU_00890 [Rhodovulum sulfidophilum]